MKRSLIILGFCVAALGIGVASFGLKRVPAGYEAVRVSRRGDLAVYESGFHLVPPNYERYLLYPIGTVKFRYPRYGSTDVLAMDGEPVAVALEIELVIPPHSARRLYQRFTEDFDSAVGRLVQAAAEVEAAHTDKASDPDRYAQAVAANVDEQMSETGVEVAAYRLLQWGEDVRRDFRPDAVEAPVRRLVVVGIDGGDWLNIEPLVAAGKLPNFRRLIEDGASGPLRSQEPLLSPLLWTTMATGKHPEEHGILNFIVADPATGRRVPITRFYRKVDAFWNMLSDYGRSVEVVGWLATHPAETVNGVMVTDKAGYLAYGTPEEGKLVQGTVYPPSRAAEIENLVVRGADVEPADLRDVVHVSDEEFKHHRDGGFEPKDPLNNLILLYASTMTYRNIALHLLDKDAPDVLAVYFEWVDAVSHLFVRHAPPRLPGIPRDEFDKYRDALAQAYVVQDHILGEIMDRLDKDTVLMVISDHGFRTGESRLSTRAEIWTADAVKWHRGNGIIAFFGRGVKKGYKIREASILDVAPTIVALQGLPRASDLPGKVLTLAFDNAVRAKLNPNMVATLQRARIEERQPDPGDDPAARAALKKLEALGYLNRADATVHNNLGQSYQTRGQYAKAIEEYKKALALKPDFHSVYNNIAVCYGEVGRHEEAEKALLKAIEIAPSDFYAMNNLAITYIETARLDKARAAAEKAVELEPGYVNGRITLGSIYAMTGDYERARDQFVVALELEPGDPTASKNLEKVESILKGKKP